VSAIVVERGDAAGVEQRAWCGEALELVRACCGDAVCCWRGA
jgi:hypothetical protein